MRKKINKPIRIYNCCAITPLLRNEKRPLRYWACNAYPLSDVQQYFPLNISLC